MSESPRPNRDHRQGDGKRPVGGKRPGDGARPSGRQGGRGDGGRPEARRDPETGRGRAGGDRRDQARGARGGVGDHRERAAGGPGGPRGARGPRDEAGARPERPKHPGQEAAPDEPATPSDFDEAALPAGVKAELKGLPKELADVVGAHIIAAGELIDADPELAFRHAEAARRRAGRIPIVREAAAETAYAAGYFDVALREFRALRRMNGGDDYLPVMADCERALGRHHDALELLGTLDPRTKNLALRIECLLVEVGIRDDLGQHGEALRLLESAISRKVGPKQGQARLRYAYAERLLALGRAQEARAWFEAAEKLDGEGLLDSTERIALIDGITLPSDMTIGAWDEVEAEEDVR